MEKLVGYTTGNSKLKTKKKVKLKDTVATRGIRKKRKVKEKPVIIL